MAAKNTTKPEWALAIHLRRTKLQKSQEEVSAAADMSQSYYSEIESGKRELPTVTLQKLIALARALNWGLYELQEATGVDLGVGKPESNAVIIPDEQVLVMCPVYPLREAGKSKMQEYPDYLVDVPKKEFFKGLQIFFEGEHPESSATLHYIDIKDTALLTGQYYLILHSGMAMVAEYKLLGGGQQGLFRNERNNDFFVAEEVQVLGRRLQAVIKSPSTPAN